MERVFLNFIEYNLYVKGSDYAKYYFILRGFAQKNKKSFPLRPLDLKTILYLQNNANRVMCSLKDIYATPLNRSFWNTLTAARKPQSAKQMNEENVQQMNQNMLKIISLIEFNPASCIVFLIQFIYWIVA